MNNIITSQSAFVLTTSGTHRASSYDQLCFDFMSLNDMSADLRYAVYLEERRQADRDRDPIGYENCNCLRLQNDVAFYAG